MKAIINKLIAILLLLVIGCMSVTSCNDGSNANDGGEGGNTEGDAENNNGGENDEAGKENEGGEYEAPIIGSSVGNKVIPMDLSLINGEGTVNVKDYEGKIVVLNFWGTWCGPCVGELPEFDELATEYDGSVVFIAVHSVQQSNKAPEFIDSNYPESKIKFAYDTPINSAIGAYFNVFGAKGYPTTLVLDKNGVITYKHTGQISGDILESEITKAIG